MVGEGRILIADDEETFRKSTADLLQLRGYDCDVAADANEAVELLKGQHYDLVISDIKMPGNADLMLAKQTRALARGTPVILVTGYPSVETAVDSINLPVSGYLVKPLNFDELLLLVQRCVHRSRILHNIQDARRQLDQWQESLDATEVLLEESSDEKGDEQINAIVNLNVKNVADLLVRFATLTDGVAENSPKTAKGESATSAQLDTACDVLTEALAVLDETKTLFQSNKLAKLRRRLRVVVDGWKHKEPPSD